MSSFGDTLPLPPANSEEPFSLPLAHPDPAAKPVPPKDLAPDQQDKLARIIDHWNQPDFKLPNSLKVLKARWAKEGGGGGSRFGGLFGRSATPSNEEMADVHPLNDVEKCYWSSQAFLRCFRATKWDYAAALRRAEETAVWRREYGVEEMKESDVWPEGETGKELVFGFDINCRPVLYMHPYRQNTEVGPRQIAFVVWCLERTIDLAPPTDPATEMLCLCIDFGANLKDAKGQPTTLGQARKVLEILQTYYCERLGKAVCVNIPQIFFAFYKLVSPFVDPITKEKIRFLDKADATALIPPQQLQKIFGGDVNLAYDHATYFPALTKLCFERKAANLERWRQYGGGKCGLDEAIIRGGRVPGQEGRPRSVAQEEADVRAGTSPDEAVAGAGAGDVEPPTAQLAAASLADENGGALATSSSSTSDATVTVPPTDAQAQSPGAEDKFVDAPVAPAAAVEKAVPAAH
ncbi:Phosphatidylinositol transfer protein (PITP) [Rhodotorula kratochvilovae]